PSLPHRSTTLFFFTTPPTPDLSTLSLHDALPIFPAASFGGRTVAVSPVPCKTPDWTEQPRESQALVSWCNKQPRNILAASVVGGDRKSTRLNSSHLVISYAVFCLKKKNNKYQTTS